MNNNPVANIDPDGSFTMIGAWLRNVSWGASGISQNKKSGEWGVEYNYTNRSGENVASVIEHGGKPQTLDEARAEALDQYKEFEHAREMGGVRLTDGGFIRTVDGKGLDAPYSWETRGRMLLGMMEPAMATSSPVNIAKLTSTASKAEFNASSFADEIVRINKTTNGEGVLLNGTPASAINSAMYYETAVEQGASIFRSISGGHMFMNGNKRTAVAVFQSFAKLHGLKTANYQQLMNVATQVATGQISDVSQIAKMLIR